MKQRRSTEIWAAGIPLDEAWRRFGSSEYRNALEAKPVSIDTINSELSKISGLGTFATICAMGGALSAGLQRRKHKVAIIDRMRSELLDELYNEQLVATGYRVSTKPSRDPVQIDPALFDNADDSIDWEKSAIFVLGQQFRDARITNLADMPPVTKTRKGRPGSNAAITAAIEDIASQNSDFCTIRRKEAANLIRLKLRADDNPGNGLSDQNLGKYIRTYCGNKLIPK